MRIPRTSLFAVAAIAAFTLSSCSSTVSASDVEDQIVEQLVADDGATLESASCPEDLAAEVDATMTCTGVYEGTEVNILVTVTSVDGSDVGFDIETVE